MEQDMNLTRGKKAAMIGLGIFLAFMAVCMVVAKGIYRSGLAQVTTQAPYSSSLVHEFRTDGTVKQGQEYGVFTESGLRVAAVTIRKGEYFEEGTPLFQVDTADLQQIINAMELEIEKLKSQQKEHLLEERETDREQQTAEVRSREDYDNAVREADAQIEKCRQALEAARQELELYDRYLALLSQDGNTVSGGNADNNSFSEGNAGNGGTEEADRIADGSTPGQQYSQQEKRHQLLQNVISCSQALEDAERLKEAALQAASRVMEDAGRESAGSLSVMVEGMEIVYQEKELLRLKELMDRDGWIYSDAAGRVTDCRVAVGERTQDGAGLLYALDEGEKIIEAVFTEGSGSRLALNGEVLLKAILPGGSRISDRVLLDYMEVLENGDVLAEMSVGELDLDIGQNVELSYFVQTDNYAACIPAACIHTDEQGGNYVYVAEEREGILGFEWRVRKVSVTIPDRTDSVVAVESAEITTDTRVVVNSTKELNDGDEIRLVSPDL